MGIKEETNKQKTNVMLRRIYKGVEGGGARRKKNLEFGPQECSGENEQGRLFGQGETQ